MSRVGTANFRHPSEHRSWMAWDGFWREGLDREECEHVCHPWNLDPIGVRPCYKGVRSSSHDAQIRMLSHQVQNPAGLPWSGKSACHSPRFHGHPGMRVTMETNKRKEDRRTERRMLRLQYLRAVQSQPDLTADVHADIGGDPTGLFSSRLDSTRSSLESTRRARETLHRYRGMQNTKGNISARTASTTSSARPPLALVR